MCAFTSNFLAGHSGESEEEEASPEAKEDIAEGWSRAGHSNSPVESLLLLCVPSVRECPL